MPQVHHEPAGRTPATRALASRLWDELQAALVGMLQETVLPASVLKVPVTP